MSPQISRIPLGLRFMVLLWLMFSANYLLAAEYVEEPFCNPSWFEGDVSDDHKAARDKVEQYGFRPGGYRIITNTHVCYKEQRATYVYILISALEQLANQSFELASSHVFNDLDKVDDAKLKNAILKAASGGLINTSNTSSLSFRPYRPISRIEALSVSVKAYESICGEININNWDDKDNFSDYPEIPRPGESRSWIQKLMAKGKSKGLTIGYDDGTFGIERDVPRHEAIGFVDKLVEEIKKCPKQPSSIQVTLKTSGSGSGSIKINNRVISSNTDVSYASNVNVTAETQNSQFSGWGSDTDCFNRSASNPTNFTATENCTIEALFTVDQTEDEDSFRMTFVRQGNGNGTLEVSYEDINSNRQETRACNRRCDIEAKADTDVRVEASPDSDSTLQWSSGSNCSGLSGNDSRATISAQRCTATAIFDLKIPDDLPDNIAPIIKRLNVPTSTQPITGIKLEWEITDTDGTVADTQVTLIEIGNGDIPLNCSEQASKYVCEPINDLANDKAYQWKIEVTDNDGDTSSDSEVFQTVGDNAPTLTLIEPINGQQVTPSGGQLRFEAIDPEGQPINITEVVIFSPAPAIDVSQNCRAIGQNQWSCELPTLEYNQTYQWRVTVNDGNKSAEETNQFSTIQNRSPVITQLQPPNAARDQAIDTILSFSVSDPEAHAISNFVVTYGRSGQGSQGTWTTLQAQNCTATANTGQGNLTTYECRLPTALEYGAGYGWMVTAEDEFGATAAATAYFTVVKDEPPSVPEQLKAQQAGKVIEENVDPSQPILLTWLPSEDQEGSIVTHDVYFLCQPDSEDNNYNVDDLNSTSWPDCQDLASNTPGQALSCQIPAEKLLLEQICYWKVMANDGINPSVSSATMSFTTLKNNPPEPPADPVIENDGNTIETSAIEPDVLMGINPDADVVLTWQGIDDDADDRVASYTLTGLTCQEGQFLENATCTIAADAFDWSTPSYTVTVYATDTHDANSLPSTWTLKIKENLPPNPAENLTLEQGGQILDATVDKVDPMMDLTFSWTDMGDPENDAIKYAVCFAKIESVSGLDPLQDGLTCLDIGQSLDAYSDDNPQILPVTDEALKYNTRYIWAVSVQDEHGNNSQLALGKFETRPAPAKLELNHVHPGQENILLDWEATGAFSEVHFYNVERIKADNLNTVDEADFDDPSKVVVVTDNNTNDDDELGENDDLKYVDDYALEKEQLYCYRIVGVDAQKQPVMLSNFRSSVHCAIAGTNVLKVDGVSGKTEGTVPIQMPNGGDLVIKSSDICLGFNGNIIRFSDLKPTVFTKAHNYEIASKEIEIAETGLPNDITHMVKISVSRTTPPFGSAPPIPNLDALKGSGSLVNLDFKVISDGSAGNDISPLKLLYHEIYGQGGFASNDTDLQSCSNIMVQGSNTPVPLEFEHSTFTVERSGLRNDLRDASNFYVTASYRKGDINGNGIVESDDVSWLLFMASLGEDIAEVSDGEFAITPDVRRAADIEPMDGDDHSAYDASALRYYLLNGTWYRPERSKATNNTNKSTQSALRSGNNPVILSLSSVETQSTDTEVTLQLNAQNLTDLSAMDIEFSYDPNIIDSIVINGSGLMSDNTSFAMERRLGIIRLSTYSLATIGGSGEIAILTVKLKAGITASETPIIIGTANLYDYYGREYVTSILQKRIKREHGLITFTDIEPPAPHTIEMPISAIMPTEPSPTTYGIGVLVVEGNQSLSEVEIQVTGALINMRTASTNVGGHALIDQLPAGEYTVTASKDGYDFATQICTVGNGQNCTIMFSTVTDGTALGEYAAYGQVTNQDGQGVGGISISLAEYITVTDAAGYWTLIGIDAGAYPIIAVQNDAVLAQDTCTVVRNGDSCDLTIQTTIVPECAIYGVQDHRVSDSQLFKIDPTTLATQNLGPEYPRYDIEGLAIQPNTGILYGSSGDRTDKQGHLYAIDPDTGEILSIGATGFKEVDAITFTPNGQLWGWAVGDGLISIDVETAASQIVIPYQQNFVEDMAYAQDGSVLYVTENTNLWAVDLANQSLELKCDNLLGESEAIETLPDHILLLAFHQDKESKVWVFDPSICQVLLEETLPTTFDDIEGLAVWPQCFR